MTYVTLVYLLGWAAMLFVVRDVAPNTRDVYRIMIAGLWPIILVYITIKWKKLKGPQA